MHRSHAAFEAFDGVLIHLVDGRTVRVPPFTVEEAMRWYRFRAAIEDGGGIPDDKELLESLPARLRLADERLEDLRIVQVGGREPQILDVAEPWAQLTFGDLTLQEAVELAAIYVAATADTYASESSRAKVRVLKSFSSAMGLASPTPAETFDCARAFTKAIYLHIYGLASDFSDFPVLGPRIGRTTTRASRAGSSSMQASTT